MGHDNRTESMSVSTSHSTVRHAVDVMADLVKGNPVDTATLAQAKQGLLDSLWSNPAAAPEASQQGLVILFASQNAAERAELIGDLAVVGIPATPVLDMIGRLDLASGFTQGEIDLIKESLPLPPRDRLQILSHWLAEEGKNDSDKRDYPAHEEGREGERKADDPFANENGNAILPGKGTFSGEEKSENDDDEPGPDPPELVAKLNDASLSQGERLDAAIQLGEVAIPPLVDLLRIPDQRGFAFAVLNSLGAQSENASAVHDAVRHLESGDPELRSLAEDIRRNIEEPGGSSGLGARHRANIPAVADGWLRSAIERCDAPSIMKAAAGREMVVIPMVTRRLSLLRTT